MPGLAVYVMYGVDYFYKKAWEAKGWRLRFEVILRAGRVLWGLTALALLSVIGIALSLVLRIVTTDLAGDALGCRNGLGNFRACSTKARRWASAGRLITSKTGIGTGGYWRCARGVRFGYLPALWMRNTQADTFRPSCIWHKRAFGGSVQGRPQCFQLKRVVFWSHSGHTRSTVAASRVQVTMATPSRATGHLPLGT